MTFKPEWFDKLDAAITICDKNGIIIYMNNRSVESFKEYGGSGLIGRNLLECHSESSRITLEEMMKSEKENIYSIEKNGTKKLILQKPLYTDAGFDGFIEISVVLPDPLVHHIRS